MERETTCPLKTTFSSDYWIYIYFTVEGSDDFAKDFSLVDDSSSIFSGYHTMHNLPRMLEFYFGDFGTRIGDSDTNLPMTVILSTFFCLSSFHSDLAERRQIQDECVSRFTCNIDIFTNYCFERCEISNRGLFLPRYMLPYLLALFLY